MVDEGSELYYDPTPLRPSESEKMDPLKDNQRGRTSSALPGHLAMQGPPGMHRQSSMGVGSPHAGSQPFDPRFGGHPSAMSGFNPGMHTPGHVPSSQFYGGPVPMAPQAQQMRDGLDPIAFSPMHDQRRMTRQMSMGMGDGFPPGMYSS